MSKLRMNLSDLGSESELDTVSRVLSKIESAGNDCLEIVCNKQIAPILIEVIKMLHLTDANKELRLIYAKEGE